MSGALKARFNPRLCAARKEVYTGTARPGEFPRLQGLLAGEGGGFSYRVECLDQGKRVRVQAKGSLELACELTLETFSQPLEVDALLEVVESEAEAALLPEEAEPVVTDNQHLVLRDLIEDELLLALPISPRKPGVEPRVYHTDAAASGEQAPQDDDRPNAFAVLEQLKKPRRE